METQSGDVRIHFRIRGDGPPVLLVHGYPLSGDLWDGVAERLADSYRLIIPDLRGHGRSESSDSARMDEQADDLVAVLGTAGEDRPVVFVGMSMGGYVAFAFCRKYPDRVRGLVLVDSRTEADSGEAAAARLRTAEKVLAEGAASVSDDMAEKLFAAESPADLRESWRTRMAATSPRGIAAALRGMAERPDSGTLLAELQLPVLVIVGAEDRITPVDGARAMAQAANATLEIIPRAGHISPVENPDAVAAALRRFLAKIGS